jgi:hypothetical protein
MGLKLPAAAGQRPASERRTATMFAGFFYPCRRVPRCCGPVYRSILPKALEFGITTKEESDTFC